MLVIGRIGSENDLDIMPPPLPYEFLDAADMINDQPNGYCGRTILHISFPRLGSCVQGQNNQPY
jgi:hypothetical protein